MIHVIDSGVLPPEKIMEKDAFLLESLKDHPIPILHFYEWEGCCFTHGYFTQPDIYLDLEEASHMHLRGARRPTGGGVIFHLTDFAFSILLPANHSRYSLNSLANYAFINQLVVQAVAKVTNQSVQADLWKPTLCEKGCQPNFCMAKPTQYDLVVQGKKLGGAAQRRKKWGYLHQGSISLSPPPSHILQAIIKNEELFRAMLLNSDFLENYVQDKDQNEMRMLLKNALREIFSGL